MWCCKRSRKGKANEKERYQAVFDGKKMAFLARVLDQVLSHMQKDEIKTFILGHVQNSTNTEMLQNVKL